MNLSERKIDFRDISVVVQGPISGLPTDKMEDRHTYLSLKSIRKSLPGAKIILSTWEDANVDDLDYDLLVRSEDPGTVVFGDLSPNCFRQVVSSINGLKRCETKYVIKTRPDLLFKNAHFLDYFVEYNRLPFDEQYKILKQRVVTLTTCNPNRRQKLPFTASDWFFFGLTEDVRNIFEIPLAKGDYSMTDTNGNTHRVDSLFSAEQYIWFTFLSKYRNIPFMYTTDISHDNIETAEKYFANNCVLISARRAGLDWIRYPGTGYAQVPALSNTGLYTFTDYRRMLNKYAKNNLLVIPNPLEELAYTIVYPLRFYMSKKSPKLHDFIRRLVNGKNHRKEDMLKKAREAKNRELPSSKE